MPCDDRVRFWAWTWAVIFGIIIDTFADLRGIQQAKEEDMRGVCFICGLDRAAFDRNGVNFVRVVGRRLKVARGRCCHCSL